MNLKSNDELKESREKWIKFFNHMFSDSHEMWNLYSLSDRLIIAYNPATTDITGYTLDELKNTPIELIYPQSELLKLGGIFENLRTKFVTNDDLQFYSKSGALKDVTIRSSLLSNEPELLALVKTTLR